MKAAVRNLFRRNLSPKAYQYVRYCWWLGRYYLPRAVACRFIKHTPKVEGFPNGDSSELVQELRNINVVVPTKVCHVMTRHGSDKGRSAHNYTTIYQALFSHLRDRNIRIFELGLGSTDQSFEFNMGQDGLAGASLRGWRELFPHACIYGADIDRAALFEEDRIRTFYCDQLISDAIRDLWSQPDLRTGMDIIIDDGLHTFEGNLSFLKDSLEHLRPGGIYVVEDIDKKTFARWRMQLQLLSSQTFINYDFALVELPNGFNDRDNNLLIIRKYK